MSTRAHIRSPIMANVPGATEGCDLARMCGGVWVCTDHVPWGDDFIHVAGASDAIVGVRLDSDSSAWIDLATMLPYDGNHPYAMGARTWEKAVEVMQADIRFSPAPTDEEVAAAAEQTLRLLQRMEG